MAKRRKRPEFDADEPYLYLAREIQMAEGISAYSAALRVVDADTPGHTSRHGKAVRLGSKLDKEPNKYHRRSSENMIRIAELWSPEAHAAYDRLRTALVSTDEAAAKVRASLQQLGAQVTPSLELLRRVFRG